MSIGEIGQNRTEVSSRKAEITLLNAVFCIAIIFVHLLSEPVSEISRGVLGGAVFAVQRILICALYGFIFLSAEKLALGAYKRKSVREFFRGRVIKIILPYIAAVLVYYAAYLKIQAQPPRLGELAVFMLTGNVAAHLYFVPVIVQFYILTPLIDKIADKLGAGYVIISALILNLIGAVFLSGLDFYSSLFIKYLFCCILGYYAGRNYDKFIDFIKRHKGALCAAYLLALCAEIWSAHAALSGGIPLPIQQTITTLYMPIAVTFWYMIFMRFADRCGAITNAVSGSSYHIYLWHILFITFSDFLLDKIGIGGIGARFLIRCAITLLLCACIPAVLSLGSRLKRKV